MLWSSIYVGEVVSDRFLDLQALFKDFYIATVTIPLDFGDDRVAPLDPHVPVRELIELFHSSFSKQDFEVIKILGSINLASDFQLFLLLHQLVLCSVADAYSNSTGPLLLTSLSLIHFFLHLLVIDILVRWLIDRSVSVQHAYFSPF